MAKESPSDAPQTVQDVNAEIVCCYIESAAIITETEKLLAAKGIKAGRARINSVIRNNPKILEWAGNRYDEKYKKSVENRLECVSNEAIQRNNEISQHLSVKNKLRWDRELGKAQPDYKKLEAFAEFAKWTSIEFINTNLVYSRFRDGLHAKTPLIDQSQHKTETLTVGEGVLPIETLKAIDDKFGLSKNRLEEFAGIQSGANGANP